MDYTKVLKYAFSATVDIGLSTSIDGYHTSDGTFRYGLTYTSLLMGYNRSYLTNLLKSLNRSKSKVGKKPSHKLRCLIAMGFKGWIDSYLIKRPDGNGSSVAKTISFDDFCLLVEFEALQVRNPKAIALLTASFREVLRSRTQEAFGLPQDTHQKRVSFFEASYQEQQRILAENREELEELRLYGEDDIDGRDKWTSLIKRYEDVDFDYYSIDLEYDLPSLEL